MPHQFELFPQGVLPPPRNLLSVSQVAARVPGLTERALRHHLYDRHANGLQMAVIALGRKLLIDEGKFHQWLDSRQHESTGDN